MCHEPFAAPVAVGGSVVPLIELTSAKGLEMTHEEPKHLMKLMELDKNTTGRFSS